MNSLLTDDVRENFLIRLYFDDSKGFYNAGIKRAFLDFCRTLKIKDDMRAKHKNNAEKFLLCKLAKLITKKFVDQSDFDKFHKATCEQLLKEWNELTIGQAQKWINMTLKYWLLFGDKRINGIDLNAKYFHIPIDSYVQKGMFDEKHPRPWSKIHNYETYMSYQERHRNKQTGNYPIIDECNFFSSYQP
ncbi:MAG TPA: hypothetical protein PKC65_07305 [Pyrinomonadaceae bacterium]|nr:hypothetical protein [Pyrinomonadaceae bacterium]